MRKLLNNPWFVTAMVLLAIALAWSSLREPSNSATQSSAVAETSEAVVDQPLPGGNKPGSSPKEALRQLSLPKTPRDPFANRNVQAATIVEAPDLVDSAHLTGIWSQNGSTLLIINERVCQVGDTIGRLTIESATQDGVWLTHWKGRDFLSVGKIFVLKTPARRASTP